MVRSSSRLSISLRKLFLIVFLCAMACWLYLKIDWIRQRRSVVEGRCGYAVGTNTVHPAPSAPGMLWLFGENGYELITIKFDGVEGADLTSDQQKEVNRVRKLFPESSEIRGLVW
jgi:hypothetical protein